MSFRGLISSSFVFLTVLSAAHADEAADRKKALDAAHGFAVSRTAVLPLGSELKIRQIDLDTLGQGHVRLDHYFNGLPVFESEVIVHVDLVSGKTIGVTDALIGFKPVSIVPKVPQTRRARRRQHILDKPPRFAGATI